MEAMCLGIPVLGSNCIGLREVLRGSPSAQVAAGSPEALAEGIARAMKEPWTEEARRYVPDARKRFARPRRGTAITRTARCHAANTILEPRRVLATLQYAGGGIRTYILNAYPTLVGMGFRFTFVGPAGPAFREFSRDLAGWEGVEFVEARLAVGAGEHHPAR